MVKVFCVSNSLMTTFNEVIDMFWCIGKSRGSECVGMMYQEAGIA
jgi:hypothetical protein